MLPIGASVQDTELTGWQQTLLAQKEELQRTLSLIMDRQVGLGLARALRRKYLSFLEIDNC